MTALAALAHNVAEMTRVAADGVVLAQAVADSPVALGSDDIYQRSMRALTMLLVSAFVIENALAVLFNWRVFLTYFSLRGIKTPISVIVSFIVVWWAGLDIVQALLAAYLTDPPRSSVVSMALTALILAGGSSGIHNLMAALGYRDSKREEKVSPAAPPTEAWVAIRITRNRAVGPIEVTITKAAAEPGDEAIGALVGTVGGRKPSLRELLTRNPDRFPQSGGFALEPNEIYVISLLARDGNRTAIHDPFSGRRLRFAPGAIVDFDVRL